MNAAQFEQCLKDGESLLKVGHELQQHIEIEDVEIQRLRDTTMKMKEKLGKENVNLEKSIDGLKGEEAMVKDEMRKEYCLAMGVPLNSGMVPNLEAVRRKIALLKEQVGCKKAELDALQQELKKINKDKELLKLLKSVAHVEFDLALDERSTRGYLTTQRGEIQSFEFDFTHQSSCDVADLMWSLV